MFRPSLISQIHLTQFQFLLIFDCFQNVTWFSYHSHRKSWSTFSSLTIICLLSYFSHYFHRFSNIIIPRPAPFGATRGFPLKYSLRLSFFRHHKQMIKVLSSVLISSAFILIITSSLIFLTLIFLRFLYKPFLRLKLLSLDLHYDSSFATHNTKPTPSLFNPPSFYSYLYSTRMS